MSNPDSSLPERWVKKIFSTMRATYGASFDRQWECPAGVDPAEHAADMLEHWGRELRGYQQSAQAIAHALDNLPPHPPNLVEFKALCRHAPQYVNQARLEAPKVPAEKMLEAVASIVKPTPANDPKEWAKALEQREKNGANLTLAQRAMWRAALNPNGGLQ